MAAGANGAPKLVDIPRAGSRKTGQIACDETYKCFFGCKCSAAGESLGTRLCGDELFV
jgi:hypothetical protein